MIIKTNASLPLLFLTSFFPCNIQIKLIRCHKRSAHPKNKAGNIDPYAENTTGVKEITKIHAEEHWHNKRQAELPDKSKIIKKLQSLSPSVAVRNDLYLRQCCQIILSYEYL